MPHARQRRCPQFLLLWLLLLPALAGADETASSSDVEAYRRDVETLAAPEMAGRGTGSPELERAGELIASRLERLGLRPAFRVGGQSVYRQPVEVRLGVTATEQSLTLVGPEGPLKGLDAGIDFNAVGFSGDGAFEGEAVFVGYGIVAPERGYDSYAGLPADGLRGKVAIAFRYEPMDGREKSLWAERGGGPWTQAAAMPNKAAWAAERGAVALLLVDPPGMDEDALRSTSGTAFGEEQSAIPVMHVRPEVLRAALKAANRDGSSAVKAYRSRADQGELIPDALAGLTLRGEVDLERPRAVIHNVGGILAGRGSLAEEVVIVGAHYDHLGRGEFGSLDEDAGGPDGKVHPGADDNASGVAGLLLLAQRLGEWAEASPEAERRTVVFFVFSGEERGLLGSNHLVSHPDELAFSFGETVAMLNFDMIGRLRDRELYVFGGDTAEAWPGLLERANGEPKLELKLTGSGMGASDHAAFFMKSIPTLHFFTGVHDDYHRPTDTADRINAEGGVRVVELAERLVRELATAPTPIKFSEESLAGVHTGGVMGHGGAFLGIMPDYSTLDGADGCGISGVTPGSPAAAAALRAGDVLVAWNGEPIGNVRDLTARLAEAEPGDRVTLTLVRGGQQVRQSVVLGER